MCGWLVYDCVVCTYTYIRFELEFFPLLFRSLNETPQKSQPIKSFYTEMKKLRKKNGKYYIFYSVRFLPFTCLRTRLFCFCIIDEVFPIYSELKWTWRVDSLQWIIELICVKWRGFSWDARTWICTILCTNDAYIFKWIRKLWLNIQFSFMMDSL